jgi:hypothetical protein
LRKCARFFLTRALGAGDVDDRGHGRVLEDGNVTYRGNIRRSIMSGPPLRKCAGPPLSECARIFLTGARGADDADVRGHGRVLEDGNVT